MYSVKVKSAQVHALVSEKKDIEENVGVNLCLAKCDDGDIEIRIVGEDDACRVAKQILASMLEMKFHSCLNAVLTSKEKWDLMKKYGLYVVKCSGKEAVDVFGNSEENINKARSEIPEVIVLDDSQCNENKDDSVVFLGTFPGQPARRRRRKVDVCNEEKCKTLGLPYNPLEYKLRNRHPVPIAIDGSNVAREHGLSKKAFSCKGIQIAVEFFSTLGHFPVRAFVPRYIRDRSERCRVPVLDAEILDELCSQNKLTFTPSGEEIDGKLTVPYDDRFILNYAAVHAAVVLSNDMYRDIADESPSFKHIATNRLLMFSFAGDLLMIPVDPKGRHGPRLMEFLSEPIIKNTNIFGAFAEVNPPECLIRKAAIRCTRVKRQTPYMRRKKFPKRLSVLRNIKRRSDLYQKRKTRMSKI